VLSAIVSQPGQKTCGFATLLRTEDCLSLKTMSMYLGFILLLVFHSTVCMLVAGQTTPLLGTSR
jgi:hypothetical protein